MKEPTKMDWNTLKEQVYFEDGSLRDIYVLDTSLEDWRKWTELVNGKYKVRFFNGNTDQEMETIDFEMVQAYWTGQVEAGNNVIVNVGAFEVNCHFFGPDELENDIHPESFQSMDDHDQLMEYLATVSVHLNKKVLLTAENCITSVAIEAEKGQIRYY